MTEDAIILALQKCNKKQNRTSLVWPRYPNVMRPTASLEDLLFTERELGLEFPPFLRRIYLEVADGKVGPGYGLYPLLAAPNSILSETIDKRDLTPDTGISWHKHLICICTFGCTFYAGVDCGNDLGAVYSFEEHHGLASEPEAASVIEWMAAWINGNLNPFGLITK